MSKSDGDRFEEFLINEVRIVYIHRSSIRLLHDGSFETPLRALNHGLSGTCYPQNKICKVSIIYSIYNIVIT